MSKKVGNKIKFNVHDVFMEGQNTAANRTMFVSSPLFPVFASLYNRSEGQIKVGLLSVVKTVDGYEFVKDVPIVTQLGLPIAVLENQNSDYNDLSFSVLHNPLGDYNFRSARVRTTNPKYLQNRLSRNSTHDAANAFDARLHRTKNLMNETVKNMIDRSIDKKFGSSLSGAPSFDSRKMASDSLITFLARHFMGETHTTEMSPVQRHEFTNMFSKFTEAREKFKNALKDTADMVSTEKWLYLTNVNGGVILGAIRPEPMSVALDKYMSDGELPSETQFAYMQESVPLKWYPSYDHIPEEHRVELEFSMVMLKAHTNSAEMLPSNQGEHFYYELGTYATCRSEGASVYVLTR
jgi:hypothetical protein